MIEKKLEDSGCGTPVDSGIHFFLIFLLSLLSRLWTVQDLIVLVNTLLEVTISFLEYLLIHLQKIPLEYRIISFLTLLCTFSRS